MVKERGRWGRERSCRSSTSGSRSKKNVGRLWKRCVREAGEGRRRRQARTGEATRGHEQDVTSARDQRLPLVLPPRSNCRAGSPFHPFPVSSALVVTNLSQRRRASSAGPQCHHCSRARGDIPLAPALTQRLLWVYGTRLLQDPLQQPQPQCRATATGDAQGLSPPVPGDPHGLPKALFTSL